jgi:hypothetical protein
VIDLRLSVTPDRRLFTSLRGRSPLPYRAQISPFRAALSAASTGGVVRHPARLVPVRIACDRERSGGHWSARRGHGDPAVRRAQERGLSTGPRPARCRKRRRRLAGAWTGVRPRINSPWCVSVKRTLQPRDRYSGGAEPLMSRRRLRLAGPGPGSACRVLPGYGGRHVCMGWAGTGEARLRSLRRAKTGYISRW